MRCDGKIARETNQNAAAVNTVTMRIAGTAVPHAQNIVTIAAPMAAWQAEPTRFAASAAPRPRCRAASARYQSPVAAKSTDSSQCDASPPLTGHPVRAVSRQAPLSRHAAPHAPHDDISPRAEKCPKGNDGKAEPDLRRRSPHRTAAEYRTAVWRRHAFSAAL